jgi:hypothetical protein
MSEALKRVIERWRDADTDARGAEHLLTQAYSDIFSKRGTTVAPELIDQVARMRARSNELLMEALAMLKARAASMFPHK